MDGVQHQPVSLGDTCACKFQLARKLNSQGHPGRSEMALRMELVPPNRGTRYFGWDLFDWIGISLPAVCEYLERDFQGVFEREDLVVGEHQVLHRLWGVDHVHDFHAAVEEGGRHGAALLDRAYPAERAKFERRAAAFRERLKTAGDFLYVHQTYSFPEAQVVQRALDALTARSPEHRVHLLILGSRDQDQDLSGLDGRVSKAYRPLESGKPRGREWEGADEAWDIALEPFTLKPPPGSASAPTKAPLR